MINKLKYKHFIATVTFSADDDVFFGKIEGINDLRPSVVRSLRYVRTPK